MPLVPQLLFSPSYFWSLLEVPTCLRIGSSHTGTLYWYNCARGRGEKTQTPQTLSLLLIADCVLSPWFGYLRNEIKRHTHTHTSGCMALGWLAGWLAGGESLLYCTAWNPQNPQHRSIFSIFINRRDRFRSLACE